MRTVMVIGGGSALAQPVIAHLTASGEVDLVVADDRRTAAERAAAVVGARAMQLDVDDADALRAALEPVDLVVHVAGPSIRSAGKVLAAAIDAGSDYIDNGDEWRPVEALVEDGRAVEAGVTAVVGMGAAPGLSNLLAAMAARDLDEVIDVFTGWPVDVDFEGRPHRHHRDDDVVGDDAAVRWMRQISGSVTTVRSGALVRSAALEPVTLDYPARGRGTAYVVGHPEPLMLRRSLRPSGTSASVMVVTEGTIAFLDGLRRDIDAGDLTPEAAADELDRPHPIRVAKAGLASLRKPRPRKLPGFFALVRGVSHGASTTIAARLVTAPPGIAAITGLPLAIAAEQLLQGAMTARGVFTPESIVDPEAMFTALAPHCERPGTSWTDIIEVDVA